MIIFAESSCLHSMIMLRISDLARDRFSHKSSSQPPEVRHAQSEEGQTRSMWLFWERKWHHAPCGPVDRLRVPALFSWRFLKISCRRVLQLQFKLFLDLYLLCNNIWVLMRARPITCDFLGSGSDITHHVVWEIDWGFLPFFLKGS